MHKKRTIRNEPEKNIKFKNFDLLLNLLIHDAMDNQKKICVSYLITSFLISLLIYFLIYGNNEAVVKLGALQEEVDEIAVSYSNKKNFLSKKIYKSNSVYVVVEIILNLQVL